MPGELATLWTIRMALACYVAYLAGWLSAGRSEQAATSWPATARWIWTLGCILFVVHVVCAFKFYHSWSHAVAFEKTASETEELLGFRFGEGIYFSYLFLVLWVVDVVALWWPRSSSTSVQPLSLAKAGPLAMHTYLFFIAFNGAIVFESGPIRWVGLAASLILAAAAIWATYNGTLIGRRRTQSLTSDL